MVEPSPSGPVADMAFRGIAAIAREYGVIDHAIVDLEGQDALGVIPAPFSNLTAVVSMPLGRM